MAGQSGHFFGGGALVKACRLDPWLGPVPTLLE